MKVRGLVVLVCFAMLAAACGATEDGSAGDTDAVTTTESSGAITGSITIAQTEGASFSRLPQFALRDRLNEQGWNIESVSFAGEDLQVEAVASGEADIGLLQALDAVRSIQLGGNVVSIASDRPDEFVAIAGADVKDCSEMEGARVAIHSEGSTYTHIYNKWLAESCGVENVERIVVSGGENRVLALLNGEIEGTNVQMADFINLDQQAPGKYQILANFGQEIDGLVGGMVLVNKDWLADNRDLAVAYLVELFKENRAANTDGAALREAAEAYQAEADVALFDRVREVYVNDLGGFPECGVLDEQVVTDLIGLFEDLDLIEPGLSPEDVVDFTVLEEARAAVDFCS